MPQIEGGYRAPQTQPLIEESLRELQKLQGSGDTDLQYLLVTHDPSNSNATNPGNIPLANALSEVSSEATPYVEIPLVEHDEPSPKAQAYLKERNGTAINLRHILVSQPRFISAMQKDPVFSGMTVEQIMKAHGDTTTVLNYLGSHTIAIRESLRGIGVADPDAYMEELITPDMIRASALVDSAVGSWLLNTKKPGDIIDRNDWYGVNIVKSLDGKEVRADVANNHGLVPALNEILNMSERLQQYYLQLFGNMAMYNDLVVLHTNRDVHNLQDIAAHIGIPETKMPAFQVRNLMPPSFVEFKKQHPDPNNAPEFMKEAILKGKTIGLILERLDPIKMDPTVMDNLEYSIKMLAGTEEGRVILDDLRIAMIARPANYGDWKTGQIYNAYTDFINRRIHHVNEVYREVTGSDENFLLINSDSEGKIAGYPHEGVKTEVYPYVNIHLQLGEEGLCQTPQEAHLSTTFGLEIPKPSVSLISSKIGFAEKVQEHKIPNAQIVEDPRNAQHVLEGLIKAYNMAQRIKAHPDSDFVQEILSVSERYYDMCGDSYYGNMIHKLVQLRSSNQK